MQSEMIKPTEWLRRRLWGLDAALCDRLVAALVAQRFLRPTARDGYVRADS